MDEGVSCQQPQQLPQPKQQPQQSQQLLQQQGQQQAQQMPQQQPQPLTQQQPYLSQQQPQQGYLPGQRLPQQEHPSLQQMQQEYRQHQGQPPQQQLQQLPLQSHPPQQLTQQQVQQQPPHQGYNLLPHVSQTPTQQAFSGIEQAQYRREPSANFAVQYQPAANISTMASSAAPDHFFTFSIAMTVICCICGGWWTLMLTVPAIFLANAARGDDAKGNHELATKKGHMALWLIIVAIIFYVSILVIIIAGSIVTG